MEEQKTANGSDDLRIDLEALEPGAEVQGRVAKIGKIGAILNVGGYPALLHISELTPGRGRTGPAVREGDEVTVWITEVDRDKKRLLVTRSRPPKRPMASLTAGSIIEGEIVRLTKFGAFVDIGAEKDGLVHISELAHHRIGDPSEVVQVGEKIEVKILSIDREKGQISLSLKATTPEPKAEPTRSFGPREREEEVLTPMQHAWQEAFEQNSRRNRPPKRKRRERERGMPKGEERDDLFLRTIRYKS